MLPLACSGVVSLNIASSLSSKALGSNPTIPHLSAIMGGQTFKNLSRCDGKDAQGQIGQLDPNQLMTWSDGSTRRVLQDHHFLFHNCSRNGLKRLQARRQPGSGRHC